MEPSLRVSLQCICGREDGKLYYNDGTEFPGIGSGSNNYAATNPALTERVEADIKAFLEKNPGVKREDIPTDLLTASVPAWIRTFPPASAAIRISISLKRPGLQRKRSKISCRKIPRAKSLASLARRLSMCSKSISRSHSGWEFCDRGGRLWRRCTISKNRSGKKSPFPILRIRHHRTIVSAAFAQSFAPSVQL